MTERVQALTELRRDETTTEEPRVPTAFEERLQQFMRQENTGTFRGGMAASSRVP